MSYKFVPYTEHLAYTIANRVPYTVYVFLNRDLRIGDNIGIMSISRRFEIRTFICLRVYPNQMF